METTKGIDLSSSLKRIAWAYGCAKKGGDEERRLGELLIAKLKQEDSDVRPS